MSGRRDEWGRERMKKEDKKREKVKEKWIATAAWCSDHKMQLLHATP